MLAGAGTDVASIRTKATFHGDHYVLNGKKSWVTSSVEGAATAVFATVDPELKHKGIACEYQSLHKHKLGAGTVIQLFK